MNIIEKLRQDLKRLDNKSEELDKEIRELFDI
jgi:hypothetical protein